MLFSTEYLNNSLARLSFIFNIFSKSILVISLFFSTNSIICFICISKFFLFSRIKLFLQDNLLFPLFPPRYIFNCSIIFYNFQLLFCSMLLNLPLFPVSWNFSVIYLIWFFQNFYLAVSYSFQLFPFVVYTSLIHCKIIL